MADSLFTWDALATLTGASLLTFLVVQYTKGLLDKLVHIPTDLYAVLIGALILIAASAALGQSLTWATIVLCICNGFIVAATAGQMANKVIQPPGSTKEGPNANA